MLLRLLYFDDCPSWQEAAQHVETAAAEFPDIVVEHLVVDTPDDAERLKFLGSPSIHLDGRDLFDHGGEDPDRFGLSCRIYQTPDGPAGSPTREQLRAALGAATTT